MFCFPNSAFLPGLTCDHCEFGFWNFSHPEGCIPCGCDPLGSLSLFCEPERGQCECKFGVGGRRCDTCGRGLFGLRMEGSCTICNCSRSGTEPGTDCDPYTGQCVCKACIAFFNYGLIILFCYLTYIFINTTI